MPRHRLSIVTLLFVVACPGDRADRTDSAASAADAAAIVRDSAGITIVENRTVDPGGLPRWSVDTTPALTIGTGAGDPAYELARIGGIERLPNGMIVVLNGPGEAAYEFRFYDSTGKHVATHGRRGQGPGEYRWISFVGSVGGDTVIGVDFPNERLNWVSASNGHLRSVRFGESGFRKILGEDATGTLETVVPLGDSLYAVKAFHENIEVPGGPRSATFHLVNLAADTSADLPPYPEPPLKLVMLDGRESAIAPIKAPVTAHVVDRARRRICAATSAAAEIACVDAEGRRFRIRWAYDTLPYTAEDRRGDEDRYREMRRGRRGGDEAELNRILATVVWPRYQDVFTALQLDTDGNFWILEYTRDDAGQRVSRFRILDPEGRLIAFADPLPMRNVGLINDMKIERNTVLRAIEDSNGIPMIGVFRIRKPDGG